MCTGFIQILYHFVRGICVPLDLVSAGSLSQVTKDKYINEINSLGFHFELSEKNCLPFYSRPLTRTLGLQGHSLEEGCKPQKQS